MSASRVADAYADPICVRARRWPPTRSVRWSASTRICSCTSRATAVARPIAYHSATIANSVTMPALIATVALMRRRSERCTLSLAAASSLRSSAASLRHPVGEIFPVRLFGVGVARVRVLEQRPLDVALPLRDGGRACLRPWRRPSRSRRCGAALRGRAPAGRTRDSAACPRGRAGCASRDSRAATSLRRAGSAAAHRGRSARSRGGLARSRRRRAGARRSAGPAIAVARNAATSRTIGGDAQNRTGGGAFAELCLTTWLRRRNRWSGWRESNSRIDLGKVTGYHYITPAPGEGPAFGRVKQIPTHGAQASHRSRR